MHGKMPCLGSDSFRPCMASGIVTEKKADCYAMGLQVPFGDVFDWFRAECVGSGSVL